MHCIFFQLNDLNFISAITNKQHKGDNKLACAETFRGGRGYERTGPLSRVKDAPRDNYEEKITTALQTLCFLRNIDETFPNYEFAFQILLSIPLMVWRLMKEAFQH